MNLRQLELLRAVIRCETTVGAARELGLSQPAVSNAIKHLEQQLGFALFERVNNRLFPTAEARALYQDSEPIFLMHAALEAKVQDLRDTKAGQIRIVGTPPLGYGAIPSALRRFLAKRPKVKVAFDVRRLEQVVETVEMGVAELGFVLGIGDHPALDVEPLLASRMVCVVRPDHPLAAKGVVTPADLHGEPFIALERGSRLGTAVREAFQQAAVPYNFAVEVRYCQTACVLAENGVGVTVVDPFSPTCSGHYDLVVRPFEPATPVTAYVLRPKGRPVSRLAEAFLREVRTSLEDVAPRLG
ncbi:LysR family transcriptional regulator [Phreatobacter aquaticus]|uniref:LysR family transcriptional regulator n=1 Tax=Phreatobacter aquaticus TaxID=2570229 RepID=A0A4D7QQ99_9HYPH|nr:LysR family transcriptional regulator [Phreatobacter aquaticus]QCK87087.1 LysR family transcriptional regulator [Phreatobacter aquaticus]